MKSLIALFSLCTLFVVLVGSSETTGVCLNPLFGRCEKFFCSVPFLPTPAVKPNTEICPDIPVGSSSCCDQNAYNAITTAFAIGHISIQNSVTRLLILRLLLQATFNDIQNLINNVTNAYPTLTSAQQNDIATGLQTILTASENFANAVIGDWANCASGLLKYWAGIMCFGCTPNWDKYILYNNATKEITVIWDLDTCTELSGACVPFFQDVANFVVGIANGVAQILQILGTYDFTTPFAEVDVCAGDCPTYICQKFVFGFEFDATAVSFAASVESGESEGSTSGTAGKRSVETVDSVMEKVRNVLNSGQRGVGDQLVHGFKSLTEAVDEIKTVNSRVAGLRGTSTVTNNYDSAGYPVYSNGKSSGLNTSVNSGSTLFNWLSVFKF